MRIIGIDPGRTTGVVVLDFIEDSIDVLYYDEIILEPVGFRSFNLLLSLTTQYHPDIMVIEDVVLHGPFNRDKFDQCKAFMQAYLAANTALCGMYPTIPVAYVTPEVRKRAGLSSLTASVIKGGHARDAFHVAIAYLYQYKKELWVKLRGNIVPAKEPSRDTD